MSQVALTAPTLPQEMLDAMQASIANIFSPVSIGSYRFIRADVRGIKLCVGNGESTETEIVPYVGSQFVFLGSAPYKHCIWYESPYQEGSSMRPTLIWYDKNDGTFPDDYPKQFHKKIKTATGEKWAHQIKFRTAWAYLRSDTDGSKFIDFENFYIFDIPSSALFGDKDPSGSGGLTWAGMARYCDRVSKQLRQLVTPHMFLTEFVQGANQGRVFFKPMPQILDGETIQDIWSFAQSTIVKEALNVQEILTRASKSTDTSTIDISEALTINVPASTPAPASEPVIAAPKIVKKPVPKTQVAPEPVSTASKPAIKTASAPKPKASTQENMSAAVSQLADVIDQAQGVTEEPPARFADLIDSLHNEDDDDDSDSIF